MPVDEESKAEGYDLLLEQYQLLSADYGHRMQQLMMIHAVLAIMLEQEGGVVLLDKQVYEAYDLYSAQINMYDPEDGTLIVEVKVEEDESGE